MLRKSLSLLALMLVPFAFTQAMALDLMEGELEPAVTLQVDTPAVLETGTSELPTNVTGIIYTVSPDMTTYVPYPNVSGMILRDNAVVTNFQADENGAFSVSGIAPGDYTVVLESESDDNFGSYELTIVDGDHLILFLNKCGLTRFPNTFDPNVPIAENKVNYYDYLHCAEDAAHDAVTGQTGAVQYYQDCGYGGYGAYGGYATYGGMGALGQLGLIGGLLGGLLPVALSNPNRNPPPGPGPLPPITKF